MNINNNKHNDEGADADGDAWLAVLPQYSDLNKNDDTINHTNASDIGHIPIHARPDSLGSNINVSGDTGIMIIVTNPNNSSTVVSLYYHYDHKL